MDIMECSDTFKDQPGMVSLTKGLQSEFDSLKTKLIEKEKRLAYLENYVSQMEKFLSQDLVNICNEMEDLRNRVLQQKRTIAKIH